MNIMTIQLSDHFNYRKLLLFTIPSMIMMVFTSIYSVVRRLFRIEFCGEDSLCCREFYHAGADDFRVGWFYVWRGR